MRSIVEGFELGCAFNLPVFPSFSALGRGEAGSYRLPALKLGKLNFCLTLLVSIGSLEQSAFHCFAYCSLLACIVLETHHI